MKYLLALTVFCLGLFLLLTGCNEPQMLKEYENFPSFLVGTWKSDKHNLEITFEPGGKIKSIRHSFGMMIDMEEGGFYEEGPNDLYAIYTMGPCEANYIANNRQLNVKIIMDYFHMVTPIGVLEGKIFDYFSGVVSSSGKTWDVRWKNYGNIVGADKWPDPNEVNPVSLTFTKN